MTDTPYTDSVLIDNADLDPEGCGKSNFVWADNCRKLERDYSRDKELLIQEIVNLRGTLREIAMAADGRLQKRELLLARSTVMSL